MRVIVIAKCTGQYHSAAVARTAQCLVLRGTLEDPDTLDYFRDAVGLVMGVFDSGGIAVFDAPMFT
jgi:hypothetical protein